MPYKRNNTASDVHIPAALVIEQKRKEKQRKENTKRKDYAFQCQFNEKPSIISDCPGAPVIL